MSSGTKYLELVRGFYQSYASMQNFQRCVAKCRVVHADEGHVKVELDLQEEHTNTFGTLHGGLTATLVDVVTTTALCATRRGTPGVSVNLTINYLAPAKIGDTILIDALVHRRGQTMAFTGADIFRKSDGVKVATALHTKAFPRDQTEQK
uniref:Acyl-coenzyme A thioesterase 13 n=2 Tax=Globodera TaxID=31242 RepID=A0A914HKW5_GLORO